MRGRKILLAYCKAVDQIVIMAWNMAAVLLGGADGCAGSADIPPEFI